MPQFPILNDMQSQAFERFLLERRPPGPQWGAMGPQAGLATLQPPTMAGLATAPPTQNMGQAYLKDQMQEREAMSAIGTPMINQSLPDTELLKQQMGAGLSSMFDTSQVRMTPQGTMDYGGMKPIRGGAEELFQNPQFIRLLRADPRKAEQAYSAITGRRMGEDFQQRQMATLARQKDVSETLRSGVLKGDIRQHPEFGFLERMTEVPNPTGIGPATKAWGTMGMQEQELYTRGWEGAFGEKLPRDNPIVSMQMPPGQGFTPETWRATKPRIWQRYMEIVGKGEMDPKSAFRQALMDTKAPGGDKGGEGDITVTGDGQNPALPQRGLSATLQMAGVPDYMAAQVSHATGMPFDTLSTAMQMGGMGQVGATQAQKVAIAANLSAKGLLQNQILSQQNQGMSKEQAIQQVLEQRYAERNKAVGEAAQKGLGYLGAAGFHTAEALMSPFQSGGENVGGAVPEFMTSSAPNLINQMSQLFGGPKLWDYQLPTSERPANPAYTMPNYPIQERTREEIESRGPMRGAPVNSAREQQNRALLKALGIEL